jgi:glycosyltransferase involved in cell wall biosynthesis
VSSILRNTKVLVLIAGILVAAFFISVNGIKFGVDFQGGTMFQIHLAEAVTDAEKMGTIEQTIQKRLDWLIERMPAIGATLPEQHVVLVGDGPERPSLESFAADLGIAERVVFAGIRSDVDAILRLGNVFMLSSRTEAFPNVILEAMATGLPVVSTDVGSVGELVLDDETGVKIPVDDAPALGGAVCDLIADRDKAQRWGANGRQMVEEKFRIEGMCDKREQLFSDLLCGGQAG